VKHFAANLLLPFVFCLGANSLAARSQPSPQSSSTLGPFPSVTLPIGTKIELTVLRPVWAISAKAGDPFYTQVSFPEVADNHLAIPAGAYVQGTIEGVTKPTRRTNRGEIDVLFTKIILADGYTVVLPGAPGGTTPAARVQGESLSAVKVQVTTSNDLLLDNGAGVEMTLEAPLVLNATQVARAIPLERAPQPQLFKSATLCRYIPGSPGTPGTPRTPDTVIPGSPGTPSTTIPGGPGMPDTVIPGTPGTSDTVIPGSPGTPGTPDTPGIACPPAPLVLSSDPISPKSQSPTSQPLAAK
jgi:hypothetical protein